MKLIRTTVLGRDVSQGHRINVNSFQQDAIVSFAGFQYAAWYEDSDLDSLSRHVWIARRKLNSTEWQKLELRDYRQTRNDGHNTISIGISGDGIIHMAYDLHNMNLNYRKSVSPVALKPEQHPWTSDIFTPNLNKLSQWDSSLFNMMTYPRFLRLENGDLLFEFRRGRSGLGDDYLWRYHVATAEWLPVGTEFGLYLKGIGNNAYINGIDYYQGKIYVSWTYRNFVEDGGPSEYSSQAGPNGPENNHDLLFAYSEDYGVTWKDSAGKALDTPIMPSAEGIVAYKIPMHSGILNQEGQTVDMSGNFHVINRENTDGTASWYHYWLKDRAWHRSAIHHNFLDTPQLIGNRAKLLCDNFDNLYALIPGNTSSSFTILRACPYDGYHEWKSVFHEEGFDGEPLFDRERRFDDRIVSILQRTSHDPRKIVVLDFVI
ncbi:hypothetical protein M433DRAFT_152978 [Acidomyces richmondensis BFW]|nr:MAG: hypothetical protein FE78DRAFT_88617 [Acidomyces sp. 'richmondensis']KYG46780.1 hypothetical protein M433DRAFT_152978 [Acidomyces richmondensis BFW]